MTFGQQFLLMLVDKLVITVIVGGALIWVQKKLEAFKASQSLDTEITKQRVDNISEGWKPLKAWDLAISDVICPANHLLSAAKLKIIPSSLRIGQLPGKTLI